MELPLELKQLIFEKAVYFLVCNTLSNSIENISDKEYFLVCKSNFFHLYKIDWWSLYWAIRWNKLQLFYWIYRNHPELFNDKILEVVIKNSGNLILVKFLVERGYKCFTRGMIWAAEKGDIELIEYLYTNFPEALSFEALIEATRKGHLHLIQWFHQFAPQFFTPTIMNIAAEGGYLNIIQWLHYNRDEGCTTSAVASAALGGHIHVVKWLKENRSEGWTDWAINIAVINGNLPILKLLAKKGHNYSEAIRLARENSGDRREIIKFLENL